MNLDSITIAAVVGGTAHGPAAYFTGIALDSRKAEPGDLFVAIKGPNHDGHDFLAAALEKATGAFVSRLVDASKFPPGRTLIRVADTLAALRTLAKYVRDTVDPKVVAVTGTVGKTTTKEMTAQVLASHFRVAKTTGNLNNTIGLPAELARMRDDTQIAVLEMGMSTPGEIRMLSELARPDAAVVTAVTPVHLMNFSSLAGVMEAKAEILAGLSREGTFVANADDPSCLAIARRHLGPVLRYGLLASPGELDVAATEVVAEGGGTQFLLHVKGKAHLTSLSLPGRHNVSNFLAAATLCLAVGLPAAEIAHGALELSPARHRGEIRTLANDVLLYDDAYNSSPAALAAAFAAFEGVAKDRRKVAVVGEMRELGKKSAELHAQAGQSLAKRFDVLIAVAGDALTLANASQKAGPAAGAVTFVASVNEAIPLVTSLLRSGDALFVKGSNGVGLSKLVEAIS